jgi:hypothetical protein
VKSIGLKQIQLEWRSGEKFKSRLGLQRDYLVSVNLFPKIENTLQLNMNCVGDAEYTSPHNFSRSITVKLYNEHYEFVNTKSKELLNGIPCKNQELILCKINGTMVTLYDGTTEWDVPYTEYNGDYAYISSVTENMIKEWNDIQNKTTELCNATECVIDLRKVGYNTKSDMELYEKHSRTRTNNEIGRVVDKKALWAD